MSKKVVHPIDPMLVRNLRQAKLQLDAAKTAVADAESEVWLAVEKLIGKIPEKGTVHATGITIETGFNDTWNQDKLTKIETTWSRKSNSPFPFKKAWKADNKAISFIRDNLPEVYAVIAEALTRNPAKPSFTLTE